MTAVKLTTTDPHQRHPNRPVGFWRCPNCATALIVRQDGRRVSFQRKQRFWKRCPGCRLRLHQLWKDAA